MPHLKPRGVPSISAHQSSSVDSVASSLLCVSPTPSDRKASALFYKRQRLDLDDMGERGVSFTSSPSTSSRSFRRPHPYSLHHSHYDARRRRGRDHLRQFAAVQAPTSSWSFASKGTDEDHRAKQELIDDDDDEEEEGMTPSPFKEIQHSVEQVHAQVARACNDVAELRALLQHAIAAHRSARSSANPRSAKPRVTIDMLCS